MQFQGLVGQLGTRHHLLCQRIGISHHAKGLICFLQTAQHLGAQYLIGSVLLSVFDGTAEGRREEQHIGITQHLYEVVIEITGLFQIAQNEDKRAKGLPDQYGREQRGRRTSQSPAIDMMNGRIVQQTVHALHIGMGSIKLLQFA